VVVPSDTIMPMSRGPFAILCGFRGYDAGYRTRLPMGTVLRAWTPAPDQQLKNGEVVNRVWIEPPM
jgi:hypothetical protein